MERIAESVPVNRTAGIVTSTGTHFEPKMKPHTIKQTDIRPPVWKGKHKSGFDLTGTRFGRFVVIGLSAEKKRRWVCRCACSNYEFRTAKAILNPLNSEDSCHVCRKIKHIKWANK